MVRPPKWIILKSAHSIQCCLKPVTTHPTSHPKKYTSPLAMAVPATPILRSKRYCSRSDAETDAPRAWQWPE